MGSWGKISLVFAIFGAWNWFVLFGLPALSQTSETFRYKLTINVTVDGKPHSASSVIEAQQERGSCLFGGRGSGSGASGGCAPQFSAIGAVPVLRLSDESAVYPLFAGAWAHDVTRRAATLSRLPHMVYVPASAWPRTVGQNRITKVPRPAHPVEIPFTYPPQFKMHPEFRFVANWRTDETRPKSVRIWPEQVLEHLGQRILIESYVIEPTTEPVIRCLPGPPEWMVLARKHAKRRGGNGSGMETCVRRSR